MTVTMPTQRTVCNPNAKHYMANQRTKYEVSRFSHSGDILEGQNLYGSHDVTTCTWFVLDGLGLGMVNLRTKFEISTFTHYDTKGDEIEKMGGLGVRGHPRSSAT